MRVGGRKGLKESGRKGGGALLCSEEKNDIRGKRGTQQPPKQERIIERPGGRRSKSWTEGRGDTTEVVGREGGLSKTGA